MSRTFTAKDEERREAADVRRKARRDAEVTRALLAAMACEADDLAELLS